MKSQLARAPRQKPQQAAQLAAAAPERAAKKKVIPVRTGRSEAPCRHARISLGYGVVPCLFRVARALRPRHLLAGASIERLPRPRRRRAVSVRTRKRHDIAPSACMSASHRARRGPLIASRGVTSPSQVACGVFTADCKIKASEIKGPGWPGAGDLFCSTPRSRTTWTCVRIGENPDGRVLHQRLRTSKNV